MEQIIIRRILDGDEKLFFLASKSLFVNPLAKTLLEKIGKYYERFLRYPTAEEIAQSVSLVPQLSNYVNHLSSLPTEENLSAEFLVFELKNQCSQHLFLDNMTAIADNIIEHDFTSLSEELYKTSLSIRELSENNETVFDPADLAIDISGEISRRLPCGLDKFDQINGGFAMGELILVGGRRGTGKSVFVLNMLKEYFKRYDFSVAFFSIEMPKTDVYNRLLSIISGVSISKMGKGGLDDDDRRQILRSKLHLFHEEGSRQAIEVFKDLQDLDKPVEDIEAALRISPKKDKSFFIIDDPTLSISKIDYYLSLLKQKSRAPLLGCCIDYLNILNDPDSRGSGDSDWQFQNTLAKQLKRIARQHEMITISPYQIDPTGKARLAVAIEDHIDCSLKFLPSKAQKDAGILPVFIDKMRNGRDDFEFTMIMDKDNLQLKNPDENFDETGEEEEEETDVRPRNAPRVYSET